MQKIRKLCLFVHRQYRAQRNSLRIQPEEESEVQAFHGEDEMEEFLRQQSPLLASSVDGGSAHRCYFLVLGYPRGARSTSDASALGGETEIAVLEYEVIRRALACAEGLGSASSLRSFVLPSQPLSASILPDVLHCQIMRHQTSEQARASSSTSRGKVPNSNDPTSLLIPWPGNEPQHTPLSRRGDTAIASNCPHACAAVIEVHTSIEAFRSNAPGMSETYAFWDSVMRWSNKRKQPADESRATPTDESSFQPSARVPHRQNRATAADASRLRGTVLSNGPPANSSESRGAY